MFSSFLFLATLYSLHREVVATQIEIGFQRLASAFLLRAPRKNLNVSFSRAV